MTRRVRGERGAVAGLEGLLFGSLILLGGTVLIVNAWAVIDVRQSLDTAAREYLRAYSEAPAAATGAVDGAIAVDDALDGRDALRRSLRIVAPDPSRFGPCAEATVVLSVTVPSARIPFVGAFGSTEVRVRHSELIDAHREVTSGDAFDPADTPCDD